MDERSRLKQIPSGALIRDVFGADETAHDGEEWPHPDYATAATRCAGDPAAAEKLRWLADDFESIVAPGSGPGSLTRMARIQPQELQPISGKCWREVLTDDTLSPRVWTALRKFSGVLKAGEMDEASRRMGVVIHAIAIARLEALGHIEPDERKRRMQQAERLFVCEQPYVPQFILHIFGRFIGISRG